MIVQSTGCSSANSDIELTDDETIAKVEISSGEYSFSEEEKETITQYIENLAGNTNVEVVFEGGLQELTSDENSLKNSWYETRYYPAVFTEEETDLAKQIISEKNSVYLNSENASPEYFNVSDINYHEGNTVGEVRAMYITPDDISGREDSFKNS